MLKSSHSQGPVALRRCGALALMLGLSAGAQALTVFDNGAPDQGYSVNMSGNVVAEDFTLADATDVSNLRFWSLQSSLADYGGSVSWTIYSNAGAAPGAVLQSGSASTAAMVTGASTPFGYAEYSFDVAVSFQLPAGSYWVGLSNGTPDPVNPSEMGWESTGTGVGAQAHYLDGTTWVDAESHLAFAVDGTVSNVPEPGALALMLAGLGFVAAVRRQR